MDSAQRAAMSDRLDQALAQSFPASDPPDLTQPRGDARDVPGARGGEASSRIPVSRTDEPSRAG